MKFPRGFFCGQQYKFPCGVYNTNFRQNLQDIAQIEKKNSYQGRPTTTTSML